jgi:hypothetical protein
MGNQVTIIIRTDALDQIEAHPAEFVQEIRKALNRVIDRSRPEGVDIAVGNHANPARVICCYHCDSTAIIASGGATASVLAVLHKWHWPSRVTMLKEMLLALGDKLAEAIRDQELGKE